MNVWQLRAGDLAAWTERFVNRTDAYGGYYTADDGRTLPYAAKASAGRRPLDRHRLEQHFRAVDAFDVVGLYALGTDSSGRWAAADIDLHDGDAGVTADQTRAFALAVYDRLRLKGFHPLLTESNGKGGYHVRALFRDPVPGEVLFRFARWMVAEWAKYGLPKRPEAFPKQPAVGEGKYGNWLRLIGRHPKRDYYPAGFDGRRWVAGDELIDFMLKLPARSADGIPREALDPDAAPVHRGNWTPAGQGDGASPWAEFDAKDEWEPMLDRLGWKPAGRSGEVQYFTRPGKEDGVSASLGHKRENGVRLFYPFTTATEFAEGRYYTPSAFYAFAFHARDFKAATLALIAKGYGRQRITLKGGITV